MGFTLVELIVTIVIAAILVAIAVPSMSGFLRSNRLTTVTNDLIADFQVARSEAIKTSTDIIVCSSSNQSSCTGTWVDGWIVFADVDGSGSWTQTAGQEDSLVKIHEPLPTGTVVTASAQVVTFNRRGLLETAGAAGDFTICDPTLKKAKVVNLNATGRTSFSETSC